MSTWFLWSKLFCRCVFESLCVFIWLFLGFWDLLFITHFYYVVCEAGFWGAGCADVCQCDSNAVTCDASSGRCVCESGYTGERCHMSMTIINCPLTDYFVFLLILFISQSLSFIFYWWAVWKAKHIQLRNWCLEMCKCCHLVAI